jgi:hypothetical protein
VAKLTVFIAHIDKYQDLACYLEKQLVAAFPDAIEVLVSSEIRNNQIDAAVPGATGVLGRPDFAVPLGKLRLTHLMKATESPKALVLLVGNDAGLRPWINFEAGAGFALGIPVIPLCHGGMVPKALPEPLRCLQALDMAMDSGVVKFFAMLAQYAKLQEHPGLPVTDIAQRFGGVPAGQPTVATAAEAELERWRLRPGSHKGEKLSAGMRLGRVGGLAGQTVEMARKAGLVPTTSLRVFLHLRPDGFEPYIECLAGNDVAEAIELCTPDSSADVELSHKGAFEWWGTRPGDVERILPLIVVTGFSQYGRTPNGPARPE